MDFTPGMVKMEGYTLDEAKAAVGKGWHEILTKFFTEMDRNVAAGYESWRGLKVVQVKEKFGGLRIYVMGGSDLVIEELFKIEDKSFKTCEFCGAEGHRRGQESGRARIKTMCNSCVDKGADA